jgi:hypothetical protein
MSVRRFRQAPADNRAAAIDDRVALATIDYGAGDARSSIAIPMFPRKGAAFDVPPR